MNWPESCGLLVAMTKFEFDELNLVNYQFVLNEEDKPGVGRGAWFYGKANQPVVGRRGE